MMSRFSPAFFEANRMRERFDNRQNSLFYFIHALYFKSDEGQMLVGT